MSKVYYNQADSRWAKHPYPSSSYPNATIKSGGCGPTAAAMIVSSFKEIILPNVMGDIFRKTGYRASSGTSGNAFLFIGEKWGLEVNVRVKLDDAMACLKRGGMVVANVKAGGVFSTGGHYIVLAGLKDENTIIVFDPYMYSNKFNILNRRNKVSVNGNEVHISYENMKEYGNYSYLYCFEPSEIPGETIKCRFNPGQDVEIDIPVALTGSVAGDDVMVDDGKNQYWVHNSVIKDNSIHARATICFGQNANYIVQVFDKQFWCSEENMKAYEEEKSISKTSTVGQIQKLRQASIIYSNSNLSGSKFNYRANTTIKILENVSNTVDKIKVIQTGRVGYIKNNLYIYLTVSKLWHDYRII